MQAVIDIGSNSVRLMLWADGKSLYKRVETTRLGEGLALSGELKEEAVTRTVHAVKAFAAEGALRGAQVHAFATAAVRAARNGGMFCQRVRESCGLGVDVVSGEEEAELGLRGVLPEGDGGIIDIGGASTEVCLAKGGKTIFSLSLPVGAVRLYDSCKDARDALLSEIGERIAPLKGVPAAAGKMYVIGGTGTTLASVMLGLERYDAQKIQDFPMPAERVSALADRLLSLDAAERRTVRGMDVRRADIIAGGALLLAQIMKKMSLAEVFASDRDNLEGYAALRGLK